MQSCGVLPCVHGTCEAKVGDALQALDAAGFPCAEVACGTALSIAQAAMTITSGKGMLVGIRTDSAASAMEALAAGAAWVTVPEKVACQLPPDAPVVIAPQATEGETACSHCANGIYRIAHADAEPQQQIPQAAGWMVESAPTSQEDIAALKDPQVLAVRFPILLGHETASLSILAAEQRWLATLGFTLAHVGINCADGQAACDVATDFARLLGMPFQDGAASAYAGSIIEAMKVQGRGRNGHIGILTHHLQRGMFYAMQKGFTFDPASRKNDEAGRAILYYLHQEIGGFAVHLLQRP